MVEKNTDEIKAAFRELQSSKVGRRARLRGTVDRILSMDGELPASRTKPAR